MLRLGYEAYATQAGDWGHWITRAIGKLYPESCKASHTNMVMANSPDGRSAAQILADSSQSLSEEEKRGLERTKWFEVEGRGESPIPFSSQLKS